MIKKKIILDEKLKKEVIEALNEEKYEVTQYEENRDYNTVTSQEVRGALQTKGGIIEFTFRK